MGQDMHFSLDGIPQRTLACPQGKEQCARRAREWAVFESSRFVKYNLTVHVISRRALREAAQKYKDAADALDAWFHAAKKADWSSLEDVRGLYPHADAAAGLTVFNIKGNRYRLIVRIQFERRKLYIKGFLTHAEYSKGEWKKWL